jgi:hypothetical protein
MQISLEGEIGIVLTLLGLFGAGAIMIAPTHTWIGWALISVAAAGAVALVLYHVSDRLPVRNTFVVVTMIICGVGFLGFAGAYFWPSPLPLHTAAPPPTSVTPQDSARIAQLQAVGALEGNFSKDEMGLRQMFDMQNILEKNIKIQVARIAFRVAGRLSDFKYNNFTEGDGSFIMLAMEGKYHTTASGVAVDEGLRDVLFLVTTEKYQSSQKALESFLNSSLIPDSMKIALRDFKATVDHDMELMTRIMV